MWYLADLSNLDLAQNNDGTIAPAGFTGLITPRPPCPSRFRVVGGTTYTLVVHQRQRHTGRAAAPLLIGWFLLQQRRDGRLLCEADWRPEVR